MSRDEIIAKARELSHEDRAAIVDALLESLDPPDPEIQEKWLAVAQKRLAEIDSGEVIPIPLDQVLERLRCRLIAE